MIGLDRTEKPGNLLILKENYSQPYALPNFKLNVRQKYGVAPFNH